ILACGNDNLYRKFCQAAGCRELAEDARFATNGKRVENRAELTRLLEQVFSRRSIREWVELLEAAGVPNGPINDVAQVFEEPQVKVRRVRIELEHSAGALLPLVASPMRFSETPLEYRLAPPLLGEHTEEVLRGLLGKSDTEIARLRAVNGQLDISSFPLDYASGKQRAFGATLMPALVRSHERAQRLNSSPFMKDIKTQIDKAGVVVLADAWLAGAIASKRTCIRRPDDIKGQKVRSAGPTFAAMWQAAGASIVSIPSNE